MSEEKECEERMWNRLAGGESFICNFTNGTTKEISLKRVVESLEKADRRHHIICKRGGRKTDRILQETRLEMDKAAHDAQDWVVFEKLAKVAEELSQKNRQLRELTEENVSLKACIQEAFVVLYSRVEPLLEDAPGLPLDRIESIKRKLAIVLDVLESKAGSRSPLLEDVNRSKNEMNQFLIDGIVNVLRKLVDVDQKTGSSKKEDLEFVRTGVREAIRLL